MPDINGKTLLVGLLATPIRHSNSPRMQSEAFAMTGVNCVQLAFEVGNEQLENAVKGLRALGAVGFNVSMPNKRMVTQYLDELSTAAALSGSVNTVVNDNGRLIGHNTDGYGFWESLRRNNIEFVSKKATLVGPGGVGAAICVQGALDGLGEIAIFTRVGKSEKTAKELVEKINANTSCKAAMYMIEDAKQFCRHDNRHIIHGHPAGHLLVFDEIPSEKGQRQLPLRKKSNELASRRNDRVRLRDRRLRDSWSRGEGLHPRHIRSLVDNGMGLRRRVLRRGARPPRQPLPL